MKVDSVKILNGFIRDSSGKQFVIPIYQRKYTWTKSNELKKLLDDLKELIKNENKTHFLGTIVFVENKIKKEDKDIHERSIVDGQQRLITLFLIVHALRWITKNGHIKKKLWEDFLVNPNLKENDKYYNRIFPSLSDNDDYEKITKDDKDIYKSDSNIAKNFIWLINELTKIIHENYDGNNDGGTYKVISAVERFNIVYISLDKDNDNAQQIFESINWKGQQLTNTDLIWNFVMFDKSNEQQTHFYKKYWKKLEDIFKNSEHTIEEFIRIYLSIENEKFTKKENLYQEFKHYWNKKIKEEKDYQDFFESLTRYANYFKSVYIDTPENDYLEIYEDFQNFESLTAAPLVLEIMEMFENKKKITKSQYKGFFEILNTYQIRRKFNGNNSNSLSSVFPQHLKLIKKLLSDNNSENFLDIIKFVIIKNHISDKMFLPTDSDLMAYMSNMNAYSLKQTKWLLEKIENNKNNAPVNTKKLSIDHIMPQKSNEYWEAKSNTNKPEEYSKLVNLIGNLTLVTNIDNSKASNKDFESKKIIFENTRHIKMNEELYKYELWTDNEIKKRTKKIIEKFIEMYPYITSKNEYLIEKKFEGKVFIEKFNFKASGYLNSDESVLIYKGSQISPETFSKKSDDSNNISKKREKLLNDKILKTDENGNLYFADDYLTTSPSLAASLIMGGARSGWDEWKDINGLKINDSLRKKRNK
ncbi:DUF4357 domain-containing protein [Mycoplasmopsis cricetuli]|uniref:DUF4357 domain-containing protein n=1 Tax=Mycoplasmopsis cricetuli TaxID=171283 RepID=UPI000470BD11|nr:DUF4357 domain-containing protein [Mycoplasmopsis cricetuli]